MQNKLTPGQCDALKEVFSIGAGNAATALSQMLKQKIGIRIPEVGLMPLDRVTDVFGGAEILVTAVYSRLLGDAQGVILLSFRQDTAKEFAGLLLLGPSAEGNKMLEELSQSAIKEVTTIICGAYLTALAKLLSMRLLVSVPGFAFDMAGAIVDNILIETAKDVDYSIIINTEFDFIASDKKIIAYFFFVPELESLEKILNIIK